MENELIPDGNNLLASDNADMIILSPGQLADYPEGLVALGGNDTVTGSSDSEVIMGNRDEDSLNSGHGNDTLMGGKENDTVEGGNGDDLVRGDRENDVVRGGEGADTLFGGKNNDLLFGDAGNDVLFGDRDDDTLIGGLGEDTLNGGEGSDVFVLQTGAGFDEIADFENGIDLIQLPEGFSFGDISLVEDNNGTEQNTLIIDTLTGEAIAQVNNVSASSLSSANFLFEDDLDEDDFDEDDLDEDDLDEDDLDEDDFDEDDLDEDDLDEDDFDEDDFDEDDFDEDDLDEDDLDEDDLDEDDLDEDDLDEDDFDEGNSNIEENNQDFIDRVVELTNEERTQLGLDPLTADPLLNQAAQTHTENMAALDFFDHTGLDGSSAGDRIEDTGYDFLAWAENIAAGQQTPEAVVEAWMSSDGHRANILNPELKEIGVGYYFLEEDTGNVNANHYWTQVFGTPFES